MAQHKIGNRILDQDEYDASVLEFLSFWMFIIGAFAVGMIAHHFIPDEWPRWLRFAGVVLPGGGAGLVLGYFAPYILVAASMTFFYGVVAGILYWVWVSV